MNNRNVESQVINPEGRRCADCPQMILKQFVSRCEELTGYCLTIGEIVNGLDLCHKAREPTK